MTHDHRPVEINLKPSHYLLRWVIATHALASLFIVALGHSLVIAFVLQLAIFSSFFLTYWRWKNPLYEKIIYDNGRFYLVISGGIKKETKLHQYYLFGKACVIGFRHRDGQVYSALSVFSLLPDSCDADALRHLRQLLLQGKVALPKVSQL